MNPSNCKELNYKIKQVSNFFLRATTLTYGFVAPLHTQRYVYLLNSKTKCCSPLNLIQRLGFFSHKTADTREVFFQCIISPFIYPAWL